ncbi:MAG: hypothetical protein ACPLRY_08125, partial [Candidatus Bathyarchaeales archaeon]
MKFPSKKDVKRYLTQMVKLSDRNVYVVSIMLALAVVTPLLIYSYISVRKTDGSISFSVLDPWKKAEKYPELLVIGQNNTCHLWLLVENDMEENVSCKVLLKITSTPISTFPVLTEANESYEVKIESGKKWEKPINITIEEPGDFHLIFELWVYDKEKGEFTFYDCVVL